MIAKNWFQMRVYTVQLCRAYIVLYLYFQKEEDGKSVEECGLQADACPVRQSLVSVSLLRIL